MCSLSSAEVPWGFSRGAGEQVRDLHILEDWGREWCELNCIHLTVNMSDKMAGHKTYSKIVKT